MLEAEPQPVNSVKLIVGKLLSQLMTFLMQILSFQPLPTLAEKLSLMKRLKEKEKWLTMLGEIVQSWLQRKASVSQAERAPFQSGSGSPGGPAGPGLLRKVVMFQRKPRRWLAPKF